MVGNMELVDLYLGHPILSLIRPLMLGQMGLKLVQWMNLSVNLKSLVKRASFFFFSRKQACYQTPISVNMSKKKTWQHFLHQTWIFEHNRISSSILMEMTLHKCFSLKEEVLFSTRFYIL